MERKLMVSSALMFALGTFVLWGMNNFLMGYAEKKFEMDPRLFTAVMWITMGIMGVALFAIMRTTGQSIQLNANLVFPIICGVLLGVGILTFSYAMGRSDMATGATAAVATSNAVFTAFLAFALLRENMSLQQWVGVAVVILGIVLLRV